MSKPTWMLWSGTPRPRRTHSAATVIRPHTREASGEQKSAVPQAKGRCSEHRPHLLRRLRIPPRRPRSPRAHGSAAIPALHPTHARRPSAFDTDDFAFVFLRCHDFAIFSEHDDRGWRSSHFEARSRTRFRSFEFRIQVPGWRSENRSGGPRFAGLAGYSHPPMVRSRR